MKKIEKSKKIAGMMCQPIGALAIGCLAGVLSVLGYKYLTVIANRLAVEFDKEK